MQLLLVIADHVLKMFLSRSSFIFFLLTVSHHMSQNVPQQAQTAQFSQQ